jgi:mono/diheme cytochrome c family protein
MGVRRFASSVLIGAAASAILAFGCSASSSSPSGGNTGNGSGANTASASAGEAAVQTRGCPKCHGNDMSGIMAPLGNQPDGVKLYPPNLTPDEETGIGKWDDLQLQEAIVEGVDNEGLNLCPQMKHYKTMPDDEVAAIIAYLRGLPPVKKVIPGSICPPLKG